MEQVPASSNNCSRYLVGIHGRLGPWGHHHSQGNTVKTSRLPGLPRLETLEMEEEEEEKWGMITDNSSPSDTARISLAGEQQSFISSNE